MVKNRPAVQETGVQSLGWEDSLRKEMATHSSILAWEFPWTEELMGYSPRDHRVRHDWANSARAHTHTHTQIVSYSELIMFTYKVEPCLNILYTHFRLLNNLICDLLFCFIDTWINNIYSIPLTCHRKSSHAIWLSILSLSSFLELWPKCIIKIESLL